MDQLLEGQNISQSASFPLQNMLDNHGLTGPTGAGFGWPQFTSHQKLRTRCYVKDDAVLIKLSVTL